MPPKKKARTTAPTSPAPKTPSAVIPEPPRRPSLADDEIVNDPWTDGQETGLFKSMIRWKATGMHKHFHMISIAQNLRSHGYTSARDAHTRIPGIWAKLRTLYDLEALDEREDAHAVNEAHDTRHPDSESPSSTDSAASDYDSFELPTEEFADMMWARRLPSPDNSIGSSPPAMPQLLDPNEPAPIPFPESLRRSETAEVSETPDAPTPTRRNARAGPRGGRAAAAEQPKEKGGGNAKHRAARGRQGSKATTVENTTEDDEGSEEDDSEEESEEETTQAPAGRGGRGRGRGGRGRGRGSGAAVGPGRRGKRQR
ncbi:hypothetical protein B0A49_00169 [Cryomyces minteri]|uniref:CT20 family protein n=1 Tax=Cryomyces minteri TaxID=331657 RepID=A0A4U0XZ59_9PEZI|nr:hypothetical protein B0A49_00169 [Cryomyces minteri]